MWTIVHMMRTTVHNAPPVTALGDAGRELQQRVDRGPALADRSGARASPVAGRNVVSAEAGEHLGEHGGLAVLDVPTGGEQDHGVVSDQLSQLGDGVGAFWLRELVPVSPSELLEPLGAVTVPAAQLCGGGNVPAPGVQRQIGLLHSSRPHSVHEHAQLLGIVGGVVDATGPHSTAWSARGVSAVGPLGEFHGPGSLPGPSRNVGTTSIGPLTDNRRRGPADPRAVLLVR